MTGQAKLDTVINQIKERLIEACLIIFEYIFNVSPLSKDNSPFLQLALFLSPIYSDFLINFFQREDQNAIIKGDDDIETLIVNISLVLSKTIPEKESYKIFSDRK
jgi:hypothetical protein